MQTLEQRVSLAMQFGWPTLAQRRQVSSSLQGKREFSELPDPVQLLILGWEQNPRDNPFGTVNEDLRERIRKTRLSA